MHRRDILLGSLGLALSGTASASANAQQAGQKRFALILANQTYEKNPLPNIRNDALLMDKTLKGIGFTTTVVLDGTRTTMLDGIRRFKASLTPGAFVLLYYSGHGAQVDGENYLIPTDNGNLDDSDAAKDQCIPLGGPNGLLEKLGRTPGQLNLIILDACRDDPFPAATKSQGSKGLAVVARPVSGDYIAMAASPGQTASANPRGMNSLYTQELVKRLATPGLRLEDVFIETRNAVVASSGGKQVPQEFGTLTAKVFLAGGASTAPIGNNNPEIKLAPTAIRLELQGVPAGATIKVDDVPLQGTTYTDEIADKTKDVEVSISANGFRPYVGKVTLTRGAASTLRVTMEPKVTEPVVPVKPVVSSRLTDYPALRAYVESLRPIPAGTFQMGSLVDPDEKPVHSVTLSAFRMGATPVTVAIWKEYCAATGTMLPKAPDWGLLDDHPVVNVSWNDIMGSDGKGSFCAWASDIAGFRMTLPTEAQFEYAARGGQDGLTYPWGNTFDDSKLWCSKSTERKSTAPVTRSSNIYRNAYDLTDMSGNVWQWCLDLYGPYPTSAQNDPIGPSSTSDNARCVRGGSWLSRNDPGVFRSADRFRGYPDGRIDLNGFRLSAVPGTSETNTGLELGKPQKLVIEDLKVGSGEEVQIGFTILVHYTSWLLNGKKIDSSFDRNEPAKFKLLSDELIVGFVHGVVGMKVGGRRKITIPPHLGYGDKDSFIPANSTLVFEVEILSVVSKNMSTDTFMR
jgi:formylglycine-generating enzyme required for sulfatase activity